MRTPPVMTAALLAALLAIPIAAHAASAPSAKTIVAKRVTHAVLPWIEDEYPRAVAEAKARKLPLFVESWAPW